MRFANKTDCKLRDGYYGRIRRQLPRAIFFRDTVPPPLRALHHCLVKKVMYHSRATFKALKKVICFSK